MVVNPWDLFYGDLSYTDYPEPIDKHYGCKVSWYIYDNQKLAQQASRAAKHNAELREMEGFDFGYMSPGQITEKDDGTFTVVIP